MKILIPSAEGIIERQWILALKDLGHEVFSHEFNPYGIGNDKLSITKTVKKNEIEVVLCFDDDSEETLLSICNDYNIKLAIWHHDTPYKFLLPAWRKHYRDIYHFCMDRYYVDIMLKYGYDKVRYLHLGTTPTIFKPVKKARKDFITEVGFVANLTIMKAHDQWDMILKNWNGNNKDHELIRNLISTAANEGIEISETINLLRDSGLDSHLIMLIIKFVETVANQERRKKPVLALRDMVDLKVVGSDWNLVGVYPHQILPRIEYYDELPVFYSSAAINLNITQPQIRRGLNQRFYDVLACEGFLISDHNDEIASFFTPDEEIVVFDDIQDLREKVVYYINRPDKRKSIAHAGREKVLACHTMKHRMAEMVSVLQNKTE